MAFKGQELPQEVQDTAEEWKQGIEKARESGMGLASFLGGFMLPGSAGLTYPKEIAKTIPESTRTLASGARRLVYQGLKSDIKDIIKHPEKYATFLEKVGVTKNKAIERGLQDYKERIKAVTSMPDSVLARVRTWSKPDYNVLGQWSEYVNRRFPTKDLGGDMSITPGMKGQAQSFVHEGIHATHGAALKLYERARIDPEAMKIWKTIPKESQEVIKDLTRIDKFHKKWYTEAGRRGAEKYEAFYDVWPAEQLAEQGPSAILGLASKLGRRLTTDEYYQALKPITSKLQKNVTVLNEQFKKLDNDIIKQVANEFK